MAAPAIMEPVAEGSRPSAAGPVLRPYQRAAIDAVYSWVSVNDGHPLIVLPTGAGKSLVMGTLAKEATENAPGTRILILAHRKELIAQNHRAVATAMPLGQIGIYSAGLRRRDLHDQVIVAGIQSIAKKPYALGAFDLVLVDEAHLVPLDDSTMYRKTIEALRLQNPHVRLVGLTATPYRLQSGLLHRGPNAIFSDICYEAPVRDLIRDGYLCPLISKATLQQLSTAGVAVRGGEYAPGALEQAVDLEDVTAAIVEELLVSFATRNKWLLFCAGVRHAEHVAEALTRAGIPAAAVHGELPAIERADRLADFKEGRLRAITSMDVLTTGYDEPAIDAIALLRPTKSTGLYVQMVGRGFRLHPSKQDTLVLDFARNVETHGPVDAIEIRDKDTGGGAGATDEEAPGKACPECRVITYLGARTCPGCGHEYPPPRPRPIEATAGTARILTTEPVPKTWHEVTEVKYALHQSRDDMGQPKTPTLRVEYYLGFRRIAQEWVCLEHLHDSFAGRKAVAWWNLRSPDLDAPTSIEQALTLVEHLASPTAIATQPEGKWTRVVDYRFAGQREPGALPRACWSCVFFAGDKAMGHMCTKWNAEPPADVQAVGCDAWSDDEDALLPF